MRFVIKGITYDMDAATVATRMRSMSPDPIQKHAVLVEDIAFPVKQVLGTVTGLRSNDFTTDRAQGILQRLGFTLTRDGAKRAAPPLLDRVAAAHDSLGGEWAWEGHVQDLFALFLEHHGWEVTGMADTATKQHGVDLLARKDSRFLGAEVKGWPSKGYADPRRAKEVKRTSPTTQAGHWFGQALMKAVMLLDSHPDYESLMVLPDYPRYRDLGRRTRTGRSTANVHLVLVREDGDARSDSWTP